MTTHAGLLIILTVTLAAMSIIVREPVAHDTIPTLSDRGQITFAGATAAGPTPAYRRGSRVGPAPIRENSTVVRLSQVAAANPNDAASREYLGQLLVDLGRPREALEHFERATRIDPTLVTAHLRRARALADLGEWDGAILSYRRAVELSPTDDSAFLELGRALHENSQDAQAVDVYASAIALNPTEGALFLSLGVSYETLRRWEEAIVAYQRCLELSPKSPEMTALKWHVIALLDNQQRVLAGS